MGEQPYPTEATVRMAVAQITGLVERRDQTQVRTEIGQVLAGLDERQRADALAHSVASVLIGQEWRRPAALETLAGFGADVDRGARIAALRQATTRIRFGDAEL